ncbi:MAG: hypothetical protein AAGN82_30860 [Myxococcota bacterium]
MQQRGARHGGDQHHRYVHLVGVLSVAVAASACTSEVTRYVTVYRDPPGTGGDSGDSSAGGAGGSGGTTPAPPENPWVTSDPDLAYVLERADLEGDEDLLCVGIHSQTRTLRGMAMRRRGLEQSLVEDFVVSSFTSDIPNAKRGFEIRDGFIYGCERHGMWRVGLDGVSQPEAEVGPPCTTFAFANDGIWIYREYFLRHYPSWEDLRADAPDDVIELNYEIDSMDSQNDDVVWAHIDTYLPFATYHLAEGPERVREYLHFVPSSFRWSFDAVDDGQTFYLSRFGQDDLRPSIKGFDHEHGTLVMEAEVDNHVHSLHCWTR